MLQQTSRAVNDAKHYETEAKADQSPDLWDCSMSSLSSVWHTLQELSLLAHTKSLKTGALPISIALLFLSITCSAPSAAPLLLLVSGYCRRTCWAVVQVDSTAAMHLQCPDNNILSLCRKSGLNLGLGQLENKTKLLENKTEARPLHSLET